MDEATARRNAYKKGKAALWLVPWVVLGVHVSDSCAVKACLLHNWARGGYEDILQDFRTALDCEAVSNAAYVFEKSLGKYPPTDWERGYPFLKIASAGLRHAVADRSVRFDPDSGLSHAWHLDANLIMAYTYAYDLEGKYAEFDDRPKHGEQQNHIVEAPTDGEPELV